MISTAPMLDAKCPGLSDSESSRNDRNSRHTAGNSVTGSLRRSAGEFIFDSSGYVSVFFSTFVFLINRNEYNYAGGNDGEDNTEVDNLTPGDQYVAQCKPQQHYACKSENVIFAHCFFSFYCMYAKIVQVESGKTNAV